MEPIVNVPEPPSNIPSDVSDENDIVTIKLKIKLFLFNHWRGLFCFLVPLILIPVHFTIPTEKYQWCAYTLVLMALFWVTECIPLPVTSIMPIVIFPMSGIMNTTMTCKCYINDTIIMFLGSMFLAYAVEQSGLHKRLALCAVRTIGYSHYKLLFAMSFITMFISMWITNTAAATMMVPINFALLQVFEKENILKIYEIGPDGDNIASDITTCYFCASTFSATIGGIGTLVGTATNLVFKGLFNKMYPDAPEYLSFPKFSAFAIPLMLILEILMYLNMLIIYFGFLRPNSAAFRSSKITPEGVEAAKKSVDEEWKKLGRITFWEIIVIILFSLAILLFFSRSPEIFLGWGDQIVQIFHLADRKFALDSSAVTLVCFLMLVVPSTTQFIEYFKTKDTTNQPSGSIPSVLNWHLMDEIMPYSFMFLLGGGFALSEAAKKEYSDLNGKIGQLLKNLSSLPNFLIIFLIIIFTTFVTNFASNVAVCNVITPIAMQLAKEINVNPLWYNIAVGFTSSFCFMLPVGTPGNLVVQSAANIPTVKMIKAGLAPSLATVIVTWIFVCFWAPLIWPDLHMLPPWL
ncbi:PREDICTED: protein I'm not dead yet-like [Papilio polytes]|uniref:protein I'm not dead yet-like n=1 Tax=Papilio polytes TaxID=76194 RepID=UPI000676281C|nr:PREDICTED: protein I'm not dead yet-like [Papilio polytes]